MIDVQAHLLRPLQGRYQLERLLGEGGMASVWLANDLRHQRTVALKVLHPELSLGLGSERFLREIRVAARLQHPHILPVFDSGAARMDGGPELLWYTMPYVDGESLRQRINRETQLPIEEAVRLCSEVAEALEYAHGKGIVHRDVKPENILLSQNHALLADFGIARALQQQEARSLTGTGAFIGTPVYMSPEQATGSRDLDGRSDIYSLGCVLYEMIAGEPPHSGPTPQALIAKRLLDPVPNIERCRPGIPTGVGRAVGRALAVLPVDRYGTAAEFATALARPEAKEDSAPGRAGWFRSPRFRLWVAPIAMVLIGVCAGVALSRRGRENIAPVAGPIRLAVLPFENIGDSARAYLTEGIVDGVRAKLADLPALQVIASTSTEEYRHSRKPVQQIGRELGVPFLLVGKVRWGDAQGLQVRPELVQASTGATRWSTPFRSTSDALTDLETDIALGITKALGVKLGKPERAVLSDTITSDPAAYAAYLGAREYVRQVSHKSAPRSLLTGAIGLYERAISLDTGFVAAKVGLAEAHRMAGLLGDEDRVNRRLADSLLTAVLAKRPDLAEALAARADLYLDHDDLTNATRLYEQALALKPNDASILARLTFVQSARGDSAALRTGAQAVSLAPRDPEMLRRVIAGTSVFRRFGELEGYSDRLIALDPSDMYGYLHKSFAQVLGRGDTAGAVKTLRTAEEVLGQTPLLIAWAYTLCGPSGWDRWHDLSLSQLAFPDLQDTLTFYWYKAQIAYAEGKGATKRAYADSLVTAGLKLPRSSQYYGSMLAMRSYGYSALADWSRAKRDLADAEPAVRVFSAAGQALFQNTFVAANAELGDLDRAIAGSRWLLEEPALYTRESLRLAPEFVRLRGYPPFEQLLADTTLP